jgi:cytochrome c5
MKTNILLILIACSLFACNNKSTITKQDGDTNTTWVMEERARNKAITANHGKQRTGLQVYDAGCIACHGKTTQGAPIPGDKDDWNERLAAGGMKQMMRHTINGYGEYMPARGGCLDCSDEELMAAVKYMIELTEIRLDLNIRM